MIEILTIIFTILGILAFLDFFIFVKEFKKANKALQEQIWDIQKDIKEIKDNIKTK